MKGSDEMVKLGFIKEGALHFGIEGKTADIDLDGFISEHAAVGGDVRVFIAVSFFTAGDDEVDDGIDCIFGSIDVTCAHLLIDFIVDKLGSSLEDKVGLIEIDLMLHLKLIDKGDMFI